MAIRDVVTGGFGNGTFSGTIALVVTRGYAIGEAVDAPDSVYFADITAGVPGFYEITSTMPAFEDITATMPGFYEITAEAVE